MGDVFVVRDDLAYATTENSVLVYDGSSWTELLTDHVGEEGYNYVYDVWANEQTIALTTTYGVYVGTPGEPLTRLPDLPADSGVYLSSVWATSAEDIWVAASSDLLRYQAGSWSKVWPNAAAEPSADCPGNVREIWGADGEVFFYTASSVHRYRDGQVETFFDVGCDPNVRVLDLWGVSPTEVYLTVQVLRSLDDCGAVEVLRFDGSRWGPVD